MSNKVNYPRNIKGKDNIAKAMDESNNNNNRTTPQSSKGYKVNDSRKFISKEAVSNKTLRGLGYGAAGAAGGYGLGKLIDYVRDKDTQLPLLTALMGGGIGGYGGYTTGENEKAPKEESKPKETTKLTGDDLAELNNLPPSQAAKVLSLYLADGNTSNIRETIESVTGPADIGLIGASLVADSNKLSKLLAKNPMLVKILGKADPVLTASYGIAEAAGSYDRAKNDVAYVDNMLNVFDKVYKGNSDPEAYKRSRDTFRKQLYSKLDKPEVGPSFEQQYVNPDGSKNRSYYADTVQEGMGVGFTAVAPQIMLPVNAVKNIADIGGDAYKNYHRDPDTAYENTLYNYGSKIKEYKRKQEEAAKRGVLSGMWHNLTSAASNPILATSAEASGKSQFQQAQDQANKLMPPGTSVKDLGLNLGRKLRDYISGK